jgi:hypothetical protein
MYAIVQHWHAVLQILSVLLRTKEASSAGTPAADPPPADTHAPFMQALLQQLPRCLYAHPPQQSTEQNGTDPTVAMSSMDTAAPSSASTEQDKAAKHDSKGTCKAPKAASQRFSPLRTTVLSAIDTLLRHHVPCFAPTVCTHLPDISAAIRYTDADTRMGACALVATLLQPERRKALQQAAEWPQAREQLFNMYVRGSSAEHSAEASKSDLRDALVVSAIELAALTALIKLQSLPGMRGHVPLRLLELIGESEHLQRAVADSNALEHLTAFVLAAVRGTIIAT